MQVLEQWVMLLDERGLRATGMELLIRVENGKAPPLGELCSSPEISLSEVERTISNARSGVESCSRQSRTTASMSRARSYERTASSNWEGCRVQV